MPATRIIFSPEATGADYAAVIGFCADKSLTLDPFVGGDGHPSLIIYDITDDDERGVAETISRLSSENAARMEEW